MPNSKVVTAMLNTDYKEGLSKTGLSNFLTSRAGSGLDSTEIAFTITRHIPSIVVHAID